MGKKLFIANLSYDTTEDTLRARLAEFGEVVSLRIIFDKMTGKSRGFAFAEMGTDKEAQDVIEKLSGQEVDGRQVVVREEQERPQGGQGGNSSFRPRHNRDHGYQH